MGKSVSESNQLIQERQRHYSSLIQDYERVKNKQHPLFRNANEFYKAHHLHRQTFLKYYHRFKQSDGDISTLLPQKRGPRYKTRRASPAIEQQVLELRAKGMNRYEIVNALKPQLKSATPSSSGVYTILRRHHQNRLTLKAKVEKRRIIKMKAGELGHIDAYHIRPNYLPGVDIPVYLVALVDDCTRIALCEIVKDLKSLTVMFATLRMLNLMNELFGIKFSDVMTDNGPEFGRQQSQNKDIHPFERLLQELGIKHRYTKPYRPQTNGKVERFWRTLREDLLEDAQYNSLAELDKEIGEYLTYYNYERPHQGIKGMTPYEQLSLVDKIS